MMLTAESPNPALDGADSAPDDAPLRMVRADIDLRAFQRWAGSRRLIRQGAFDEGYAMHCLLTEIYGELAPKPFRIIAPRDSADGVLYGYANADADDLRDFSRMCACPLQATIIPAESVQSKTMPDKWRAGQRLGFETLVRPVVRSRTIGAAGAASKTVHDAARRSDFSPNGKVVEVDAYQYEAAPLGKCEMNRTREDVYKDWLEKQLANRGGAALEEASLRSFRRTRAVRRLRGRSSEGPAALMRGTLVIGENPAKFGEMLRKGVGRHRAYGFGMLLVRPPKPAGAL